MAVELEEVRIRVRPGGRVSRSDAALYLGLSPNTLAHWRCVGIGPRSRKLPGTNRVYYLIADLEAYLATGAREAA
jgi:hypothetical protein